MFGILGILVVFGAVVGGYLMEHGSLKVLVQPAELIIIGGAAAGTVLVANPPNILKGILAGMAAVFGGGKFTQATYLKTLTQLFAVMQKARKGGLPALEADVAAPAKSNTSVPAEAAECGEAPPVTAFLRSSARRMTT